MKAEKHDRLLPVLATLGTLLFYLATTSGYGYFRDEFYYLANARHLDFGYVDHPPLIALVTASVTRLFGESLFAIRLVPAIAAALTVWVTVQLAREFGGGRFAQGTAAIAAFSAPIYLNLFSILSMNSLDILVWALAWWILARLLSGADLRLWLVFGSIVGVGLLNKLSVLYLGAGIAAGLVIDRRWDLARQLHVFYAVLVAGAFTLPYLFWQIAHGWPTLEWIEAAQTSKNAEFSVGAFLLQQVLFFGPAALLLSLGGLAFLFGVRGPRTWRAIAWAIVVIALLMMVTKAKPYYLSPAFTVLLAAGAVATERWTARFSTRAGRVIAVSLLVCSGTFLAPMAKALMPVADYIRYEAALGIRSSSGERHETAELPQHFADMHGWRELAASVATVYDGLSPEEKSDVCVVAANYGQAGSIEFFGTEHALPAVISGHNSYFLWGPGECAGHVLIVVGIQRERLEALFGDVQLGAVEECRNCMPYERNKPIWLVRQPRMSMAEMWPQFKNFN